jgi:hypothetical protein
MRPAWVRVALGVVALGSGAALLSTIVLRVPLQYSLLAAVALWIALFLLALARRRVNPRSVVVRHIAAGAVAGFGATLAYDVSRVFLSQLDPAPYNPFEAIRVFGVLLTGSEMANSSGAVMVVGSLYHLLNGTSFGVAYALILGHRMSSPGRALVAGTAWGVGLELFQLTVYPGWLNIKAYDEFLRVSFLGHVVYGAVLGLTCRTLLARSRSSPDLPPPGFTDIHIRG